MSASPAVDGGEQGLPLFRRARRVAVDAQDAGLGKTFDQHGFRGAACRARRAACRLLPQSGQARGTRLEAAVVAAQALVGQVQHQVGGAAPATRDPAAGRAGQYRRIAAAVEEDQALFAAVEAALQAGQQRGRKAFLQFLAPRVDDAHRGHGLGHGALGQFQQPGSARCGGVVEGLQRRRGRTEHDGDVRLMRAPDRHVARRVAQAFLLLERGVVLLVDDDQAGAAWA
jgi:hypothetical protein